MGSLSQGRFRAAEFWRNVWTVNPDVDTTLNDMLSDSYWSHVASQLKPWDRIEARAEDGSFFAEFVVVDCDRTWAKVHPISFIQISKSDKPEVHVSKEYFAKWSGPHYKWRVIRTKDKEPVKDGLPNQEAAIAWINQHLKAIEK